MIDPTKKYRPYEGESVEIQTSDGALSGGIWHGPDGQIEHVFWDGNNKCYRHIQATERFRAGDLIEVPEVTEEVTVVRDVILWAAAENRVITTIPGDASSGDTFLGRVRFTHNGKELLKCEIVK